MTNAELIPKIKAEIEKRLLEKDHGFEDGEAEHGYNACLKDMRRFLSTLESEKPMNPDGLVNEIESYWKENGPVSHAEYDRLAKCARHFAKWQYQKDRGKFAQIKAKTWSEGFDACKEQMMKEARNHFVLRVLSDNTTKKMIELYNDEVDCKFGDVVRIIIVKEN